MLSFAGASGNGLSFAPDGITDSVDGDDGMLDGSGNGGHSYFFLATTADAIKADAKRLRSAVRCPDDAA